MSQTRPQPAGRDRITTFIMGFIALLVMLSLAVIGYSLMRSQDDAVSVWGHSQTQSLPQTRSQAQPPLAGGAQPSPETAFYYAGVFTVAFFVGVLALIVAFYFLPTYVAVHYRHPEITRITLCNILFGFTGLGWLACFIWAVVPDQRDVLRALERR